MLSDDKLISAAIADRAAFTAAVDVINAKELHDMAAKVWAVVDSFYTDDPDITSIDRDVLKAKLAAEAPTEKLGEVVVSYVQALPVVSAINVVSTCHSIRARRMRLELVDKLLAGAPEADGLMREYTDFVASAASAGGKRESDQMSVSELCAAATSKIKVHPKALDEVLGGGINRGETILIFGRPGSAKTAAAVNIAGSLAKQGYKVAYACNEEGKRKITLRFLSLLGSTSLDDMQHWDQAVSHKNIDRAVVRAAAHGMNNIYIRHGMATWNNVMQFINDIKPDVVVLDQLRNVRGGGYEGSMHNDMEAVQRAMRMAAVSRNFIGITVAQAGASAQNKEILEEIDLDGAKTGVQGAVDVVIGVGVTMELRNAGKRVWNICRNKVNGIIKSFVVHVDEAFTRIQ